MPDEKKEDAGMFHSEKATGLNRKIYGAMCAAFATTLLMIAGIASPAGEAQGTQKGAARTVKLTPQQLGEIAKAQLLTHGTLSPKISNPNADSATAGIIAALRSQKQVADMELQELSTMVPATTQGSGPQASPPASTATPAASSGKAGGKPGANAAIATNVSQPRSNLAAPSATPPHPTGAEHPQTAILCRQPYIGTVNGKASGIIFTPEAEWNLYTIKGCGFGNAAGNIYLKGPFKEGRIPLQILPNKDPKHPTFVWRDTAIVASLDTRLTGELDRDNVTLVIEPASGSPMEEPGFKFFAARETVQLKSIPDLAIRLGAPSDDWIASFRQGVPGLAVDVYRSAVWDPQNPNEHRPFEPGTDVFDFSILAAGFNVASAQIEHFDGDSSEVVIKKSTGWNVVWEANGVRVNWGVSEVSTCFNGNCKDWQGQLQASLSGQVSNNYVEASLYGLNVWVSGPRGVSPWRTAMGGQPNPAVKPKGLILAPHQPNPTNKPHP
jgi:hypothetical protein